MENRLDIVAREGNIEALYYLMKEDAHLLEHFEAVPFVDTPLHVAASAGQVHFAVEIMRLKPSFARKSNQNGYSPIHLAMQNAHTNLVLRLLDIDRDLVRVRGREGKTPLHFAVECGEIDLLAEFLLVCPKSIQDLTIRKETALHVAVKSDKLEALKVLLGWLEHVGKKGVLNWGDDEGNTILHIAAARNQTKMVRLIIDRIDLNAKNSAGLTALDISPEQTQPNSGTLKLMLHRAGALKASALPTVPKLADSLKSKMSWREKWIISDYRKRLYLSNEDRNIILLVAVLFATANYQAALDSFSKGDDDDPSTYFAYYSDGVVRAIFSLVNKIAFLASMVVIYLHLPADCGILRLVLPLVICNYAVMKIYREISFSLMLCVIFFMILCYHSKLAIILHKYVPIFVQKRVMKMKITILDRCSSFHRELVA
ncbi:Ankyrin repeat-containing protein [Morus notabilis]|uniref:Ankyrin repeat-containing protein n=1 Tax=Morus notabilis TaxID=981085 RepID=W9S5L9_9ROSA|nr:ankyrin repeat-containing protein BDA1 [Morus notabilis]EXC26788.1 Ankyrin repeat-containing protein [Morus notabilis]